MLHDLSIGELADRLNAKQISSVELTRHFLARIERLNPTLNALITLTAEQALESAAVSSASHSFIKIFFAPTAFAPAVVRACSTISSRPMMRPSSRGSSP